MTKWHCGGTCDDRPAGGVWAGWERTGLAVGGWTRVRAGVSSTQANQGVFVLMCLLCVLVGRGIQKGSGAERQGRSPPEIALNAPCDRFERSYNLPLTELCFDGLCWRENKRTFCSKSKPGVQALCEPVTGIITILKIIEDILHNLGIYIHEIWIHWHFKGMR